MSIVRLVIPFGDMSMFLVEVCSRNIFLVPTKIVNNT